jgi:hypothetical protein
MVKRSKKITQEFMRETEPYTSEMLRVSQHHYEEFKEEYELLMPAMKAYLEQKGYLLPKNPHELYRMFFSEIRFTINGKKIKPENLKYLKREDFIGFSKEIEEEIEPSKKTELTLRETALKAYYEGSTIQKSEGKVYQHFTFYCSNANRKGKPNPFTHLKLKNKINLFERVIELLPKDKKGRAIDELKIINSYLVEFE